MDITFSCDNCKQELEADSSLSGSAIQCPSCGANLVIPEADPQTVKTHSPIAASAAAKIERHFSVPTHDGPVETLIKKGPAPLEVAARDEDKTIRVKTIKRTDCVEVGHDRFDEVVTQFLGKVGQANIITISPINYQHLDIGSQKLMTDFGVMIVYKG